MEPHIQTGAEDVDLHPEGEGVVRVLDYDAFILSQREAVQMLRDQQRQIKHAEEMRAKVDELFTDIAMWGIGHENIDRIDWNPREDDTLITVLAVGEDEEGELHDSMAKLDLQIHEKYAYFRINFLLFRASEADGVASFANPTNDRVIKRAKSSSSP